MFFKAYFMVASMGLTALSLLMTVYIVNIFHHNPHKEVPRWLKKYVLNILAKVTCFTPKGEGAYNITYRKWKENGDANSSIIEVNSSVANNGTRRSVFVPNNRAFWNSVDSKIRAISHPEAKTMPEEYNSRLKPKETDQSDWLKNKEDWRKASRILDRINLILTVIAVVALTLFLFIGIHT